MSSTPRCNRIGGTLVIDGTETTLYGCPCCPEYIGCSSTDCHGDESQACTTAPLLGCFCNWPGRIMFPYLQDSRPPGNEPPIYINDLDALFSDPNFNPYASHSLSTTAAVSSRTSWSTLSETRLPASTAPITTTQVVLQNSTWMDLLSNQQESFSLYHNSSVFLMLDHLKHMQMDSLTLKVAIIRIY